MCSDLPGAFRLAPRVNRDAGVAMATATVARGAETEVLSPGSEDEAIAAFGDGAGMTVLAGGTIVVPEMTYGYLKPERVLMLGERGACGSRTRRLAHDDRRDDLGRRISSSWPRHSASCAANVADREIRAQATVGGNLCAPVGRDAPRGDLQAAFLALDAQVRSAGAGGERTDSVDDFLADRDGTARARRQLRRAGRGRVRPARPAAYARLLRAHRLRRACSRRRRPASP